MKLSEKIQRTIQNKRFPSEATLYNWLQEAKGLEDAVIAQGKELPAGRRRQQFTPEAPEAAGDIEKLVRDLVAAALNK